MSLSLPSTIPINSTKAPLVPEFSSLEITLISPVTPLSEPLLLSFDFPHPVNANVVVTVAATTAKIFFLIFLLLLLSNNYLLCVDVLPNTPIYYFFNVKSKVLEMLNQCKIKKSPHCDIFPFADTII